MERQIDVTLYDWRPELPYVGSFNKWSNLLDYIENLKDIMELTDCSKIILQYSNDVEVSMSSTFVKNCYKFLKHELGSVVMNDWTKENYIDMNSIWRTLKFKYMPDIRSITIK